MRKVIPLVVPMSLLTYWVGASQAKDEAAAAISPVNLPSTAPHTRHTAPVKSRKLPVPRYSALTYLASCSLELSDIQSLEGEEDLSTGEISDETSSVDSDSDEGPSDDDFADDRDITPQLPWIERNLLVPAPS